MNLEELQAKVRTLEYRLSTLDDIEEIKRLQRIYGYYLDNCMWDEIIDLFSDDTESIELSDSGVFLGKEGVKKVFNFLRDKAQTPGFLHITLQLQGIVDVEPDSKTAKGRWQTIMFLSLPVEKELRQILGHGVYVNEYVKENGKWLFKKLHFNLNFRTPFEEGWVKTPVMGVIGGTIKPDLPTTVYKPYPSAYKIPFHYKHPITGK